VECSRERGIAFAFFDNAAGEARVTLTDGRKVVSGAAVPWTWQIAEFFKIEKGLIGLRLEHLGRCHVEPATLVAAPSAHTPSAAIGARRSFWHII